MSYFNYFRAHDQFMPRHFGFRGGGFFGPPRGGVSITENVTIKNGPSGFWGFMTGLTQGLFGGGMGCGMGMGGSIFGGMPMMGMGMPMMGYGMSPYAMLNGAVTPQGPGQAQVGEDKHLKNLQQAYGKSYEITSHPDKKGIYQAFPKDGTKPIEGTYDELCTKLAEDKEEPKVKPQKDPEKTEAQLKEEKAKEKGLELKDGKYMKGEDEYVWDSSIKDFKKVDKKPVELEEDQLDKKVGRTKTTKKAKRTRDTGGSDPVEETQTHTVKKVPIHWNIRRHVFNRFSGEAVIQFNDNEGKWHSFKAEKNGWHSYVGTEAGFKAELADDLRRQLAQARLDDQFVI